MTNSNRQNTISKHSMTATMVVGCLLIAGAVYWSFGASGLGNSLFLLILFACPLLHFFMHRRGGHHEDPPSVDADHGEHHGGS